MVKDENISYSAITELKEELNILVDNKNLFYLGVCKPIPNNKKSYSFSHHFYIIDKKERKNIKFQKEEITDVKYFDFYEFKKLTKNNDKKFSTNWQREKNIFDLVENIINNYSEYII